MESDSVSPGVSADSAEEYLEWCDETILELDCSHRQLLLRPSFVDRGCYSHYSPKRMAGFARRLSGPAY